MVVYAEYVFLDNFLIDALLLLLARKTLKLDSKAFGVCVSSLTGAVAALLVPLISVNKGALFVARVVLGFLLVAASGKFRTAKEYIFCYYLFLFYTFLFGGGVAATAALLGVNYDVLTTFSDGKLPVGFCLACCFILYFAIARAVKKLSERPRSNSPPIVRLRSATKVTPFAGLSTAATGSYIRRFPAPWRYVPRARSARRFSKKICPFIISASLK